MKVVIVSTNDIKGGAARAAYRLHCSLISAGVQSSMLVQFKESSDPTVIEVDNSWHHWVSRVRRFCEKALSAALTSNDQAFTSFAWLSNRPVVRAINALEADIVHLHWCNSGLLSTSDFTRIKGRVVWTLHDMWAFTSGMHVDPRFDPRYVAEHPTELTLIERFTLNRKRKIYEKINRWTVVGLSRWISHAAKISILLSDFNHINLPNPINTDVFQSCDRFESRNQLGIEKSDIVILFGAMNAETDANKGLQSLIDALNSLPVDYRVIFFGATSTATVFPLRQRLTLLGTVRSDHDLISLYSAADVMVVPSRCENLSNTVMEALSCSLPVVAFDVGGNEDMLQHQVNGYLAVPDDPRDLARGIRWAVNPDNNANARKAARDLVLQNFDAQVVAKKYIQLYESL